MFLLGRLRGSESSKFQIVSLYSCNPSNLFYVTRTNVVLNLRSESISFPVRTYLVQLPGNTDCTGTPGPRRNE